MIDDDLLRLAAEALGRHRDPGDHSPNCVDGDPCRYCLSDVAAVLEAVLPEVRARALEDAADGLRDGATRAIASGTRLRDRIVGPSIEVCLGTAADWLRTWADEERGAGR